MIRRSSTDAKDVIPAAVKALQEYVGRSASGGAGKSEIDPWTCNNVGRRGINKDSLPHLTNQATWEMANLAGQEPSACQRYNWQRQNHGLTPNRSAITRPVAGYQATNPMREMKMTSGHPAAQGTAARIKWRLFFN